MPRKSSSPPPVVGSRDHLRGLLRDAEASLLRSEREMDKLNRSEPGLRDLAVAVSNLHAVLDAIVERLPAK